MSNPIAKTQQPLEHLIPAVTDIAKYMGELHRKYNFPRHSYQQLHRLQFIFRTDQSEQTYWQRQGVQLGFWLATPLHFAVGSGCIPYEKTGLFMEKHGKFSEAFEEFWQSNPQLGEGWQPDRDFRIILERNLVQIALETFWGMGILGCGLALKSIPITVAAAFLGGLIGLIVSVGIAGYRYQIQSEVDDSLENNNPQSYYQTLENLTPTAVITGAAIAAATANTLFMWPSNAQLIVARLGIFVVTAVMISVCALVGFGIDCSIAGCTSLRQKLAALTASAS